MKITDGSGERNLHQPRQPGPGAQLLRHLHGARSRGSVEITKEEQYFRGHRDADERYGFGFRWARGSK
jgi:hypothetical protein